MAERQARRQGRTSAGSPVGDEHVVIRKRAGEWARVGRDDGVSLVHCADEHRCGRAAAVDDDAGLSAGACQAGNIAGRLEHEPETLAAGPELVVRAEPCFDGLGEIARSGKQERHLFHD
jgi:hypothetical protein